MKYIILLLICFNVYAQEPVRTEPTPSKCWYSSQGYFCGDYKDDDPHVIANGECDLGEIKKPEHPRGHVKLKENGKVECPPVVDNARKAQAEAKKAEAQAKADKKKAAETYLKGLDKSKLTTVEQKMLEALGL